MQFYVRKIGRRFSVSINKINISYCFKGQKDRYITLGVNCFPRTKLTKFGVKAKKSDGELSYPFDLCAVPLESVAQILSNDFGDFLDNLYFDPELNIWVDKKYSINYFHDKDIAHEKFVDRYKKRIENFKLKTAKIENLVFISAVFCGGYNPELYKSIYSSLKKYCKKNQNFKYLIVNITDELKHCDVVVLDNIIYKEITEPFPNYKFRWTDTNLDKTTDGILDFYDEYIKFVETYAGNV